MSKSNECLPQNTVRQIIIGVQANMIVGCELYEKLEKLMAAVWRNEVVRPRFYLDFGPQSETLKSNLLCNPNIDFVIRISSAEVKKKITSEDLINLIYEIDNNTTRVKLKQEHDSLLDFNLQIVRSPLSEYKAEPKSTRVGAILGMGPLAGASCVRKISQSLIDCKADMSTISFYGYSNPASPQPIASQAVSGFLFGANRGPMSYIRAFAEFVGRQDIDFLIAPCNTFHTNLPSINKYIINTTEKLYSIIDIVTDLTIKVCKDSKGIKVGLMATNRTIESDIYKKSFIKAGGDINYPGDMQQTVQDGINLVKAGSIAEAEKKFDSVIDKLMKEGVKIIILGCTEIPLAVDKDKWVSKGITFIDTAQALADATVSRINNLQAEEQKVANAKKQRK